MANRLELSKKQNFLETLFISPRKDLLSEDNIAKYRYAKHIKKVCIKAEEYF